MSSGWHSSHDDRPGGKEVRLREALADGIGGIRDGIAAISRSDTGRLLLFGDMLMQAATSLPGRTFLSVFSLWAAWAIL